MLVELLVQTCAPFCLGSILLFICLFTHSYPGRYTYVRLFLAPPAIFSFWTFGFNGEQFAYSRIMATAMAVVGWYGIMRVLEHTVIHLWEPESPRWIMRTESSHGGLKEYPGPQTLGERCFYAFDLFTSQRGSSWAGDREWDWIPRRFRKNLGRIPSSSTQYIAENIKSFVFEYLLLDFIDTVCKEYKWNPDSFHPVTELPLLQQVIFSFAVCTGIYLAIATQYFGFSAACILCGSSVASWPPMFDSPFLATSLRDFWSRRWHSMFRRVFTRLSVPFVQLARRISGREEGNFVSAVKVITAFGFSAVLHMVIMRRVTRWEINRRGGGPNLHCSGLWDPDVFYFFMAQPLGIFIEVFFIEKVADWLFPPQTETSSRPRNDDRSGVAVRKDGSLETLSNSQKAPRRWERDAVTRLFTWCFLLWTGRWWSDKWVRVGFFDKEERMMPISILRSLWYGRWSY